MASADPRVALFVAAGLNPKTAKQILKKKKVAAALCDVLAEVGCTVATPCARSVSNLLYDLCTKLEEGMQQHRSTMVEYIRTGQIATGRQLEHAIKHLKQLASDATVDVAALEAAAGIGVVVSGDEVSAAVAAAIAPFEEQIRADRFAFAQGRVMSSKKFKEGNMLWANGKLIKDTVAAQFDAILGPRTAEDDAKAAERKKGGKKKKKKQKQPKAAKKEAAAAAAAAYEGQSLFALAEAAGMSGRLLESMQNSEAAYEEHRRVTGGVIRTRFPPEPNGYLHIGHAKSMHLNFHGAFEKLKMKGETIFRYDDTNPAAESVEFIDSIRESVGWLGWTPCRTTYSSEYFDELYALAIKLIRRGYAYVCHETKTDMAAAREIAKKLHERAQLVNAKRLAKGGKSDGSVAVTALDFVAELGDPRSPTRDRTVEENVRLFEAMRNGAYPTGGATLRMKMDWSNPNPNFWDPVAYRIKYVTHPHVGDKWCIYPSYDYTHCIVDSLEHIDYSLCTLEFEARRDSCVGKREREREREMERGVVLQCKKIAPQYFFSASLSHTRCPPSSPLLTLPHMRRYYWLLDMLDLWKPYVWEFGRLNLTHTMMSKRKLRYLVENGHVRGWDDPRLPTLYGLERRGVPPSAINDFCSEISVTRTAVTLIPSHRLHHCARNVLNGTACRAMGVLEPLKIEITNWAEKHGGDADATEWIEAYDFPAVPERGTHRVALSRTVYIERSDFKEVDEKTFYGMAPGKTVHLKYAHDVTCTEVIVDASGAVVGLKATLTTEEQAAADAAANAGLSKKKQKKKGNLHWVSAPAGQTPPTCEVREYDELFTIEDTNKLPAGQGEWLKHINTESEIVKRGVMLDGSIIAATAKKGDAYQFERVGYFVVDPDSRFTANGLIFNRTLTLKAAKR